MIIWFASGNKHKKEELQDILSLELKIPSDAGLAFNPDENGNSFLENAMIKARELHKLLTQTKKTGIWQQNDLIIADDSGLCVDALGGRPGIHSARYGGENLSAAEKNALLLKELGGNSNRSARFVCAMVLYCDEDRFFTAQECLEGELVKNAESVRGKGGFGYDPILYIPHIDRTVAELTAKEKNLLSHRGKAGKTISAIINSVCPQARLDHKPCR